jgi:AbrB family looped-hinge helix DNA binding protein
MMPEYLQVRSNGQITLPAATRRKAKLQEGDLLEAVVEEDGSIRLAPKLRRTGNESSNINYRMSIEH